MVVFPPFLLSQLVPSRQMLTYEMWSPAMEQLCFFFTGFLSSFKYPPNFPFLINFMVSSTLQIWNYEICALRLKWLFFLLSLLSELVLARQILALTHKMGTIMFFSRDFLSYLIGSVPSSKYPQFSLSPKFHSWRSYLGLLWYEICPFLHQHCKFGIMEQTMYQIQLSDIYL